MNTSGSDCRICGNSIDNEIFEAKEMMIGLRERFRYLKCRECGCLMIIDPPPDLTPYYPNDYYSMITDLPARSRLRSLLSRVRDGSLVNGKGLFGRFLASIFPIESLKYYSGIPLTTRILDVGCGRGDLLYRLKETGFSNLLGIDPFIPADIHYPNGLTIEKKTLADINSQWEIITYHHSFEHISDPQSEIIKISEHLVTGGLCILRIPFADSFAWENYGTDWVQLDAPRHYFLFTHKSLDYLLRDAGLALEKIESDSDEFQFLGSEQYKRDIALGDARSYYVNRKNSIFTKEELKVFKRKASELNRLGKGDQVALYLRKG
jgi:SAM-dependent methyltransferase